MAPHAQRPGMVRKARGTGGLAWPSAALRVRLVQAAASRRVELLRLSFSLRFGFRLGLSLGRRVLAHTEATPARSMVVALALVLRVGAIRQAVLALVARLLPAGEVSSIHEVGSRCHEGVRSADVLSTLEALIPWAANPSMGQLLSGVHVGCCCCSSATHLGEIRMRLAIKGAAKGFLSAGIVRAAQRCKSADDLCHLRIALHLMAIGVPCLLIALLPVPLACARTAFHRCSQVPP